MDLLRKKDIVEAIGLPKSTVSDWLAEFAAFIPSLREGSTTLYRPEAIDVLRAIQGMRTDGHTKSAIVRLLADQGFALNAGPAVPVVSRDGYTQALATMSQALATLADQGGRIEALERELAQLRAELAAAREHKRKWWHFR